MNNCDGYVGRQAATIDLMVERRDLSQLLKKATPTRRRLIVGRDGRGAGGRSDRTLDTHVATLASRRRDPASMGAPHDRNLLPALHAGRKLGSACWSSMST